uniref:Uncharacterized protein n=1 Tax=Sipha flava TaxID=143950 RepID=A0A2S2Q1X2_9HEMI
MRTGGLLQNPLEKCRDSRDGERSWEVMTTNVRSIENCTKKVSSASVEMLWRVVITIRLSGAINNAPIDRCSDPVIFNNGSTMFVVAIIDATDNGVLAVNVDQYHGMWLLCPLFSFVLYLYLVFVVR